MNQPAPATNYAEAQAEAMRIRERLTQIAHVQMKSNLDFSDPHLDEDLTIVCAYNLGWYDALLAGKKDFDELVASVARLSSK